MPPWRMNLSTVKIRQLKATTDLHDDPVFKSPRTTQKWAAEVQLRCQVEMNAYNAYSPNRTGDSKRSNGHLTFKKKYLDDKGVTLKNGDRITGILDKGATFTTTDFRIVQVRATGRLPNPTLIIAEFRDAREEKAAP